MTTLRETVAALPADERLEYALACWEMLTGQDEAPTRIVNGVKLTPREATLLALLKSRAGRIVSAGSIMAVFDANSADANSSPGSVKAHVCYLRKKVAGEFRIRTVWGHGYVLEAVQERGTSANSEARMTASSSSTTSASITST